MIWKNTKPCISNVQMQGFLLTFFIDMKLLLELRQTKKSQRAIASTRHISTKSVAAVWRRADELGINLTDVADKTPDEIYTLFFPEKFQKETVYAPVDYGYVHNELKKCVPLILYQEIMVRLKERRQCGSNPVRLRFSERDTHLICSISHTQLSANNKHSWRIY